MKMGEVILFEHQNFHGAHKHIFADEPNLNNGEDRFLVVRGQFIDADRQGTSDVFRNFNDVTSSIVIVSGTWQFYADANYQRPIGPPLTGPQLIRWVGDITNDIISSIKKVG